MKGLGIIIDHIDFEILALLKENSRIQWKEIGQKVHMTGQAVGNRIRRLEDMGIIEQYTIAINRVKLIQPITAFITFFVETTDHKTFHDFFKAQEAISEAHRTSGDGCYLLTGHFGSNEELEMFLERLLTYGNYRINLSIGKIK
ncbi:MULTISPECIES: Lrp/AsnC family transcriptional regulator [Planococcus]|uniref:Transcriptional regulator n=2 Tax=Planococcus TaxID=1372 RepID=A0ABM5X0Q8_9BACL|nr:MULTISPECIES: Lrp/AsnC family transcriptional regulator [Planococcus]ALS80209.1 transcriptional regulator [Planococcus kocurii]AQU81121.1 transcriptional regulator [Planococcus faecalis]KAA0959279.1 Lrp/AsnC family transcriptional regulator [Planococcus sp. ANT_H30]MDJ0331909.1 Lrp/AsnC family transcriptional regulator [Planococcus sp. S3-L1]OHX55928.1 transcriptional regulator [Planococcus faecalis]